MNRREFIRTSAFAVAASQLPTASLAAPNKLRAAIIGHTGRGNYGHDLDRIFNEFENVEVVAVADPDEKGRAKAAQRSNALRQYSDYREMLGKERPQLVSVAPRWSDQHFDMAHAAIAAGAHIFVEKPFTRTLAEADDLLAMATRDDLKIAVAHQMRLSPGVVLLKQEVANGLIGRLMQIRSWGKQDKRAGGEDLVVLGTHVFDMMRLFAGDAVSCVAEIWHQGQPITEKHAREAGERIGLVAGNEIEARFTFSKQVTATFTSREGLRDTLGPWAVELVGTKGIVRILMDIDPRIYIVKAEAWGERERIERWERFDAPAEQGFPAANRRVVKDWLQSITEKREPACSGYNGMKALEMVMGIYESALAHSIATFPLNRRQHPLAG